jgi:hypothetical protein
MRHVPTEEENEWAPQLVWDITRSENKVSYYCRDSYDESEILNSAWHTFFISKSFKIDLWI